LGELAEEYGAKPFGRLPESDPSNLCIDCGRCVRACAEEGAACLDFAWRGWARKISPAFGEPPKDCIGCASCASCCPTGAIEITEGKETRYIWGRKFELVHCKVCGKIIGTREQLEALGDKYPEDQLCDRCRKRSFASQFLPRDKRS
jgi:predicted molibdopterin-dependent oxidoreductase YjgC